MINVEMRREGSKLIVEIDLDQRNGKSKSGKTVVIASTSGNVTVPDSDGKIKLGLNCYTYEG